MLDQFYASIYGFLRDLELEQYIYLQKSRDDE